MIDKEKRGLSPVIATTLLISLALVLAVIVFLWARAFIPEAVSKQGQKVDLVCEDVSFKAEAFTDDKIYIENTGTVPIYGIEIRVKKLLGEITNVQEFRGKNIGTGQSTDVPLPEAVQAKGTELVLVPILLGETKTEKKAYPCDKEFGVEVIVS